MKEETKVVFVTSQRRGKFTEHLGRPAARRQLRRGELARLSGSCADFRPLWLADCSVAGRGAEGGTDKVKTFMGLLGGILFPPSGGVAPAHRSGESGCEED